MIIAAQTAFFNETVGKIGAPVWAVPIDQTERFRSNPGI